MLRCYEDKNYENSETVIKIRNNEIRINLNAATLVIVCVVKM